MSKLTCTTLGEIIASGGGKIQTGPFGSQLHASDYVEFGTPCIMPANMKDNRVDLTDISLISEHDAKRLSRHLVEAGDIIYSRRGDITQKALIRETEAGYFCGTGCLLIRPGKDIDSEFLTYYLSTTSSKNWVINQAVGATMPNLNTKSLSKVPLSIPDKTTQQKIAAILSSLDAKIELNNRINAELELMAKTLYDYWFVQFDFPDANGKPYKSSGGKMVYNTTLKRDIPAGWEAATLSQFIEFERGVTYGKEDVCTSDTQDSIGILRATNVTGNVVDVNDLVFVPASKVSSAQVLKKYETLIVMSSGSKEHVGKNGIYYFDEPRGFGAFCSKLTASANHRFFVNTFLQSPWFKAHIKNSCLGTNINNLTNDHINECLIVKPDVITAQLFEDKVSVCYEKISNNASENQHLTQLRDWLLPMLMNGQVTVA